MASLEEKFSMIQDMGWTRADAQEALTAARGDLQGALEWLLTNCAQGKVGTIEETPAKKTTSPNAGKDSAPPNFVPPPPMDASDHEDARHLAALKRNPSNDFPPPAGHVPEPAKTAKQEPTRAVQPPTTSSAPNSAPITTQEPVALSSGAFSASPIMENAPMIQVCYRGKSSSPELLEKDAFLHLLQREHMPCVAVDIEDRRDLEDILMAAGVTLPQAVLAYQPLGDLQEFSHNLPALRRLVAKKIASGLQSEHSSSLDEYRRDSTVKTGAVDGVMNLLASAASALSSGWTHSQSGSSTNTQTNGSGESTSAGSNAQTTPGSPPVVRATTTHSYIEFTVIKTNWFYRDQLRIIRFGTNGDFHRIEPKTKELKESVPYSTITAISVGPGAITLTLKTGLLHSFRAPQRVIDYMYQLFLAYCPEDVTPTFTQR